MMLKSKHRVHINDLRVAKYISSYNASAKFHTMPFQGSFLEQPYDFVRMFNAIADEEGEHQAFVARNSGGR